MERIGARAFVVCRLPSVVGDLEAGAAAIPLRCIAPDYPLWVGGKPRSARALTRWAVAGVPSASGRRVSLETARIKGEVVTTRSALVRFIVKVADAQRADWAQLVAHEQCSVTPAIQQAWTRLV